MDADLCLCEHDCNVMNAFVVGFVFYSKKCLLSLVDTTEGHTERTVKTDLRQLLFHYIRVHMSTIFFLLQLTCLLLRY